MRKHSLNALIEKTQTQFNTKHYTANWRTHRQ